VPLLSKRRPAAPNSSAPLVTLDDNDISAEFATIDTDGKGQINVEQFCDWAVKKLLDAETDKCALCSPQPAHA
jgi:hypothetical protein